VAIWINGTLERAYLVIGTCLDFLDDLPGGVNLAVVECPQVYPGSPVKHEDLIQLAFSAGAIAGRLDCPVVQARPGIWTKATVTKKEIRLKRAWERLTNEERGRVEMPATKSRKADVLDALAIGLWYLKRW
jgi:hypothetical protein